ncbi:MAG: DNA topoisomerase IB, partial [Candidatus Nanopelagicales bacterium]
MPRLRRSDLNAAGLRRSKRGKGFTYLASDGRAVSSDDLERIRKLVIPPAWQEVWISPHAHGHIQATGVDAAGRRQYLYHPHWRIQRDLAKHERVLTLATALPEARIRVAEGLELSTPDYERTMAAAFRLLDVGFFRVGSEQYAQRHGTFGLATLQRSDVSVRGDTVRFSFVGKHSIPVSRRIIDPPLAQVVRSLLRRRDDNPELLAWREGRRWQDVASGDINEYVRSVTGADYTAKDFRTWHGTVLAATALAVSQGAADDPGKAKRAIRRAIVEVASYLGNTPAVARGSY